MNWSRSRYRSALLLLALALWFVSLPRPALSAMESNITILDRSGIKGLSDDKLLDVYIDVIVELKAIESFHTTSGFTPKEYDNYKQLLRYKILLLEQIDERKLKVPRLDDGANSN